MRDENRTRIALLLIILGNTAQRLCDRCVVKFFGRLPRNSAGILPYGKGFLGNMTENLHADCVQSRQTGFMQCFLEYDNRQSASFNREKRIHKRVGVFLQKW